MKKIRIGVIGIGLVGAFHAEAFMRNPMSDLIAICDIDLQRVKNLADNYNCNYYTDYKDLIEKEDLDAISIATPESVRLEPAILSSLKNLKILLEKPLGKNIGEIENLVNFLKDYNELISVNFILHEEPRYKYMKEKIKNKEIGRIVSCFGRRRGNRFGIEKYAPWTDLLSSTLIHDIQMVLEINQSKPIRVFAEAVIRECEKYGSHDAVMSLLKFSDGSIASFESSWVLPKNQPEPLDPAFHVIGDKGSIIIEGSSQGMQIQTEKTYLRPDLTHWPLIGDKVEGSLKRNLDKFITDCLENNLPDVNLLKAFEAEKIVFAMKESIKTNMPIKINS